MIITQTDTGETVIFEKPDYTVIHRDGSMEVTLSGRVFTIDPEETRRVFEYLTRQGTEDLDAFVDRMVDALGDGFTRIEDAITGLEYSIDHMVGGDD